MQRGFEGVMPEWTNRLGWVIDEDAGMGILIGSFHVVVRSVVLYGVSIDFGILF